MVILFWDFLIFLLFICLFTYFLLLQKMFRFGSKEILLLFVFFCYILEIWSAFSSVYVLLVRNCLVMSIYVLFNSFLEQVRYSLI